MEATNQESYERDYTEFLEELEEDKLFRQNVNIYFSESLCLPPPYTNWCQFMAYKFARCQLHALSPSGVYKPLLALIFKSYFNNIKYIVEQPILATVGNHYMKA